MLHGVGDNGEKVVGNRGYCGMMIDTSSWFLGILFECKEYLCGLPYINRKMFIMLKYCGGMLLSQNCLSHT